MTNKIKLIKSFAGYPVWEYHLHWDRYIQNNTDLPYAIHKDIVEWMPSCFAEVEEQRQKVEWEYYCANNQFGDSYYVQHWEPYHTKPEIKLIWLQVKSLQKLKLLCKLLTTMEEEFGIKETRITTDDVFICPRIDTDKIGDTHMERLVKSMIK